MSATSIILLITVLTTIVAPIGYYFIAAKNKGGRSAKNTLFINIGTFAAAVVIATIVGFAQTTMAAEGTAVTGAGLGYLAAALAVGLACIGSGVAVANSASAALGALSEDSTVFGKSLVFVGLSEGIALYGLIIAFMILGAL